jgi:hypothetical protein
MAKAVSGLDEVFGSERHLIVTEERMLEASNAANA